jgi:hypothetical protein
MICGLLYTIGSPDRFLADNTPTMGVPVSAQPPAPLSGFPRSISWEALGIKLAGATGTASSSGRTLPSARHWPLDSVVSDSRVEGASPQLTNRWPQGQQSVGRGVASDARLETPK